MAKKQARRTGPELPAVGPAGRNYARGERHGRHKVDNKQVRQIRIAYKRRKKTGETLASIGKRFEGISATQVHNIGTGKSWPDAPGPITPSRGKPRGEYHHMVKANLPDAKVAEIR